jgi:hypothetical protein
MLGVYAVRNRPYVSLIPLVLIAVIALFYIGTLRDGHVWGDDFALFVLHAQNIVEGRGYADTLYVPNPLYPDIGPEAYPPGTAIVLAPVYKWFGFDVRVMKIVLCTFFLGTLWVLFWVYRFQLPWPYAAGLVVLVGLNPYFWDFKDEIMSEFVFMFFLWITLYATQRHYENRDGTRFLGSPFYASLVGVCMYLTYSARVIGIILIPSLLLYEVVRFKKLTRFSIISGLIAGSLIAVQAVLLSDVGKGYGQLTAFHDGHIGQIATLLVTNAILYVINWSSFLDNGYRKTVELALFAIVSVLAAVGVRRRIKDGITVMDVFFFLYLVAVLVTLRHMIFRYLFPILPIYFLYAYLGAREVGSLRSGRGWQYAPIILIGAVVLSYAFKYTTINYGPIREGISREESTEMFQYIREHTEASDVIIFRKPRALALITGRRASVYPMPPYSSSGGEEAWDYFHHIGARYFVVGASAWTRNRLRGEDIAWERRFVTTCQDRCEEVFSNADFKVYKLKDLGETHALHAVQD